MHQVNEIHKTKTIVLSEQTYQKLRKLGKFQESFDDVISRILEIETSQNIRNWSEK